MELSALEVRENGLCIYVFGVELHVNGVAEYYEGEEEILIFTIN